jgi:hypothetical protein
MAVDNFIEAIEKPYGKYPASALAIYGWAVVGVVLAGAVIFQLARRTDGRR